MAQARGMTGPCCGLPQRKRRADEAGEVRDAAEVALRGLRAARQTGLEAWFMRHLLAANAAEALLARGRTAEAAALIDPLTTGPPDRDHWLVHEGPRRDRPAARRHRGGHPAAAADQRAARPHRQHRHRPAKTAQRAAELALWAGRPGDALQEARRVLALFTAPGPDDLLRAAAGGGHARLRRSGRAGPGAPRRTRRRPPRPPPTSLVSWVDQMAGAPFADHPFVAAIPADRATWDAERTRLAGRKRPRGVERGRQDLGGAGLPAPGRVRLVAAGPGAAGRRAARHRGGRRAAGRRGRRRGPRAAAGADPRARPAGAHPAAPAAGRGHRGAAGRCRRPTGSPDGSWRCCGCSPPAAPTRRSAPSCTSAPGPPASTSPTFCASSACPTGCRPPPSPNAPDWPIPGWPKHCAPESKHPPAPARHDTTIRPLLP